MRYNHKQERKALLQQHEKERPLLLKQGIPTEMIDELFQFDEEMGRDNRRYYRRVWPYIEQDETKNVVPDVADTSLDYLAQMEDTRLYAALMSLKPVERKIVALHVIEGIALLSIAARLGKPYGTILSLKCRAVKKIKKFY